MFDGIQHIGYVTRDLDAAAAWFEKTLGATNAGGTQMAKSRMFPGGGRNAFLRFGAVEAELMEPANASDIAAGTLVMHHVGYITHDITAAAEKAKAKGLKFLADAPYTNPMGQQVLYFDPDTTNGVWMHLTKVPEHKVSKPANGPWISGILHPGILVGDIDKETAWYVEKLGGTVAGTGRSARGGRVAFIDCGGAQVELIEAPDATALGARQKLDHVGHITDSLDADVAAYRAKGMSFLTPEPVVNPIGQRLIYFATECSMGARMHITALPK